MTGSRLQGWFERESRRELGRVTLEDGLVFGRLGRYVWQRSARFALTRSVQEVLHVAELSLLFLLAPQEVFIGAALVHIATRLASNGWWGGLDVLREGVRERARDGRFADVGPWIRAWLVPTAAASCGIGLASAGYAIAMALTAGAGMAEVYIAARVLALAVELPVRAFHSGAWALRRVRITTHALLAPSVLRIILVATLWPVAGLWSIPAAMFGNHVLGAVLTWRYTRRTYRDLGIEPLARARHPSRRRPAGTDVRRFAGAAVAYAVTGVGALWSMALLTIGMADPDLWIALFIYVVLAGPLFEASLAWVKLFYPDLARLEGDLLRPFRTLLERQLVRASIAAGTLAWLPTMLLLPMLPVGAARWLAPLTWLFFVARARFAVIQMLLFCSGRHVHLLLVSVAASAGVAAAALSGDALSAWLAGGMVVLLLLVVDPVSWSRSHAPPAGVLPLAAAVAAARRITGSGHWNLGEFRPGRLLHGSTAMIARSARRSGPVGTDRDTLLLRWIAAGTRQADADAVSECESRRWLSPAGRAVDALRGWCAGWPPMRLPRPRSTAEIVARFRRRFPNGDCAIPGDPVSAGLRARLNWRERRFVLREAVQHAYGRGTRAHLPVDVSALLEDGRIAVLFFVERDASLAARREWRSWLRRVAVANELAAIEAPPAGETAISWSEAAGRRLRMRAKRLRPDPASRGSSGPGNPAADTAGSGRQ